MYRWPSLYADFLSEILHIYAFKIMAFQRKVSSNLPMLLVSRYAQICHIRANFLGLYLSHITRAACTVFAAILIVKLYQITFKGPEEEDDYCLCGKSRCDYELPKKVRGGNFSALDDFLRCIFFDFLLFIVNRTHSCCLYACKIK